MAMRITPLGDVAQVQPGNGRAFTLQELQEGVSGSGGDENRLVEIAAQNESLTLLCNEEGLLLEMDFNPMATGIARGIYPESSYPGYEPYIVGPCLLLTQGEWDAANEEGEESEAEECEPWAEAETLPDERVQETPIDSASLPGLRSRLKKAQTFHWMGGVAIVLYGPKHGKHCGRLDAITGANLTDASYTENPEVITRIDLDEIETLLVMSDEELLTLLKHCRETEDP